MDKVSNVMAYIVLITFVIIAYTVWNNAQIEQERTDMLMNETFIYSPPLKQITLVYDTPGSRDLEVKSISKYKGTKISIAEFEFNDLDGVTEVIYEFQITDRIIRKLDINKSTVNVYTKFNGSLVKAGSDLVNNTITLKTKKLIPVILLADANGQTVLSDEEIFYNSKTPIGKAYDNVKSTALIPRNTVLISFVVLGLLMIIILIKIERNKRPNKRSTDHSIEEYITAARREGIHDDEILARLVEEGIKPSHAAMMLRRT